MVGEGGRKIVKATEMTRIAKDRLDLARSFPTCTSTTGLVGCSLVANPMGVQESGPCGCRFLSQQG